MATAPAAAFAGTTLAAVGRMSLLVNRDDSGTAGTMRTRMSTGDGIKLEACPHQFVGRCDDCSASAALTESDQMVTDEGGTTFSAESGPYPST
ncbi:hypothetical protein FHJ30_15605 [Arthrobacter sp. BB-1]|uniref:hypothetical protein n=1 Tax=unclassified Arthrobacter TaxID=235627 RepID=UPI00111274B0|nr:MULTISPECIES: hypothetical protein [unclassified Arthrobacter]TNB70524.1 hypothetical protein FHJ30_15605 [Arthrobacter sp. BB-1]